MAFFEVSDFCHIKYSRFCEFFGEQQCIKPAKLHFVITLFHFDRNSVFLKYFIIVLERGFVTGTFVLIRRKIFLGIFIDTNAKNGCIILRIRLNFRNHIVLKQYSNILSIVALKFKKQSSRGVHLQKRYSLKILQNFQKNSCVGESFY